MKKGWLKEGEKAILSPGVPSRCDPRPEGLLPRAGARCLYTMENLSASLSLSVRARRPPRSGCGLPQRRHILRQGDPPGNIHAADVFSSCGAGLARILFHGSHPFL